MGKNVCNVGVTLKGYIACADVMEIVEKREHPERYWSLGGRAHRKSPARWSGFLSLGKTAADVITGLGCTNSIVNTSEAARRLICLTWMGATYR